MVKYEFLWHPLEGATEEESADSEQVFFEGVLFDDCVKQFAEWLKTHGYLVESIDEEAERYEGEERTEEFITLPKDEEPFRWYI